MDTNLIERPGVSEAEMGNEAEMGMEWVKTDKGHRLDYRGHVLEIRRRRPDAIERRTYVVYVDGREDPVPVWDIRSAKTRALKNAMSNGTREIKRLTKEMQSAMLNTAEPEVLEKPPEPEPEVLENLVTDQAEQVTEQVVAPVDLAEVRYTITGSFPLSKLGSGYNTLETAIEALRELGAVGCTVQTPNKIEM